jgi:hypothetical protein
MFSRTTPPREEAAGIYTFDDAALNGDKFIGNHASFGGGIDDEWQTTLADSIFRQNRASSDGGAIYEDQPLPSHLSVGAPSSITDNFAAGDGGGIYHAGSAIISVRPSTVENNHPDNCAPENSVAGCTG